MVKPLEAADQMAAVGETGFLRYGGQVVIRKEQQVLGLGEADKLDVLLAALAVLTMKDLGEIGVAHVAHFRQIIHQ